MAFYVLKIHPFPPELTRQILIQITEAPHAKVDSRVKLPLGPMPLKKNRSIRLKDLGIPLGIEGAVSVARKSETHEVDGDEAGVRYGQNGVDLIAEGKNSKMFRFIRERIENDLTYPGEFKQRSIQGTVHARVTFSQDGEFLEGETEIRSSSNYLKVLITRALRKAFRESIPESKRTLSKKFTVQCVFIFQITEHNDETIAKSQSTQMGDQLAFYRNYQHSALQWQLGPLSGLGPLAGVDVLWFPRKIDELFSKKAKIDPMESYRNDPAW